MVGKKAYQAAGQPRGLVQLMAGKDSAPPTRPRHSQGDEASLLPTQAQLSTTS